MICEWFPCIDDADTTVWVGDDVKTEVGHLCVAHVKELAGTFKLYRMGNLGRLAQVGVSGTASSPMAPPPVKTPSLDIDMTLCGGETGYDCGHPSTAHYPSSFVGGGRTAPAGCHACNALGRSCARMQMGHREYKPSAFPLEEETPGLPE